MSIRNSIKPVVSRLFGRTVTPAKLRRQRVAFRPEVEAELESRKLLAFALASFLDTGTGTLNIQVDSSDPSDEGATLTLQMNQIPASVNYQIVASLTPDPGSGPAPASIFASATFTKLVIFKSVTANGNPDAKISIVLNGPQPISAVVGGQLAELETLSLNLGSASDYRNLTLTQNFNISSVGNITGGGNFTNVFVNKNTNLLQPIAFVKDGGNISFGTSGTSATEFAVNDVTLNKSINFNSTVANTNLSTGGTNSAFIFDSGAGSVSFDGNITFNGTGSTNAFFFQSGLTSLTLGSYTQANVNGFDRTVNVSAGADGILASNVTGNAIVDGNLTISTGTTLTGDVTAGFGNLTVEGKIAGNVTLNSGSSLVAPLGSNGITGDVTSDGGVAITAGNFDGEFVLNGSPLTISGGDFTGNVTLNAVSSALIEGGKLAGQCFTQNGGSLTVNNTGNITGDIFSDGSLIIDSTALVANSLTKTGGTLTFSDGEITGLLDTSVGGTIQQLAELNDLEVNGGIVDVYPGVTINGNVNVITGSAVIDSSITIGGDLDVAAGASASGGFGVTGSAGISGTATVGAIGSFATVSGTLTSTSVGGYACVTGGTLSTGSIGSYADLNAGTLTASSVTGSLAASFSSSATVTGSTGAVTVSTGSSVTVDGTVSGSLTVCDTSSTAQVGLVTGDVLVENGGFANLTGGASGSYVNVTDSGSRIELTDGTVSGEVNVKNVATFQANGTSEISGNVFVGLGAGDTASFTSLDSANITGDLTFDGATTGTLSSSAAVGGNLNVNGTSTVTTSSDIAGLITINLDGTNGATLNLNSINTNSTGPALYEFATLNIGAGGSVQSLNFGANDITVSITDGEVRDGITMTGGSLTTAGSTTIGGDVSISGATSGSEVTLGGVSINGDLSVSGSFNNANVTVTMQVLGGNITANDGANLTLAMPSGFTGQVDVSDTGTEVVIRAMTVDGELNMSGGNTTLELGALVNGTTNVTGGKITYGNGTLAAGTQNGTFEFTNSAEVYLGNATTFTGNMTVNGTATVSGSQLTLQDATDFLVENDAGISADLVLNNVTGTIKDSADLTGDVTVGALSDLTVDAEINPLSLTVLNGGSLALNNATDIGTGGLDSNGTLNIGVVAVNVDGPVTFGPGSLLQINYDETVTVPGSSSNASYVNVTNSTISTVTLDGTLELASLNRTSAGLPEITFLHLENTTATIPTEFDNQGNVINGVNLGIEVLNDPDYELKLGNYTASTIFVDDNFTGAGTVNFWRSGTETQALLGTNAFATLADAIATKDTVMTDNSNLVIGSGFYTGDLNLVGQGTKVANLAVSLANLTSQSGSQDKAEVTLTGDLVLSPENSLTFRVFGNADPTADKLTVQGAISLDGDLSLRAGNVSTTSLNNDLSNRLVLIKNDGGSAVTGKFANVDDGQSGIEVTNFTGGPGNVGSSWFFQNLTASATPGDVGIVIAPDTIDTALGDVIADAQAGLDNLTIGRIRTDNGRELIYGLDLWANIVQARDVTNLSDGSLRIYGGLYANGTIALAGSASSGLTIKLGETTDFSQTGQVIIAGDVFFNGNTTLVAGASSVSTLANLSASNITYTGSDNALSFTVPLNVPLLDGFVFLNSEDGPIAGITTPSLSITDGSLISMRSPIVFNDPLPLSTGNFTPVCVTSASNAEQVIRLISTANGSQAYANVAADASFTGTFGQDITVGGTDYVYGITFFSTQGGNIGGLQDAVNAAELAVSTLGSGNLTITGSGTFFEEVTITEQFALNRDGTSSANIDGNLTFQPGGSMADWQTTGQWFTVGGDILVDGYGAANDLASFKPFELIAETDSNIDLIFDNGSYTNANLSYTIGGTHPGNGSVRIASNGATLTRGSAGPVVDLDVNAADWDVTLDNLTLAGGSTPGNLIEWSSDQLAADAPSYALNNVSVSATGSSSVTDLASITGNLTLNVSAIAGLDNTFNLIHRTTDDKGVLSSSTDWQSKGIVFGKVNVQDLSVYALDGNDTFNLGNGTNNANFAGQASFYGGLGDDTLNIYNNDSTATSGNASALTIFDGEADNNTIRTFLAFAITPVHGYDFTLSGLHSGGVSLGILGSSSITPLGSVTGYANVRNLIGSASDDYFRITNLGVGNIDRVYSIDGIGGQNQMVIDGATGLYTSTTFRAYYENLAGTGPLIQDGWLSVFDSVSGNGAESQYSVETFTNLQVFKGGASYDLYAFIGNPNFVASIDAGANGGALDYSNYYESDKPGNFNIDGVTVNLFSKSADLIAGGASNGFSNITAVYGSSFDDFLYGGTSNDILYGSSGDDYIDGGRGNDIVIGDYGADTVVSGTGFDLVTGDVYNPYYNYGDLTIPFQLVLDRIQTQIWNGITSTTQFDLAVESLRAGTGTAPTRYMTQRGTSNLLSAPPQYGGGTLNIPVFLGPDTTPEAATASTFTIINDASTDTIRMLGTTSPSSATYLLYSGGPSNTQFSDNITGLQSGIRRRNRTWII